MTSLKKKFLEWEEKNNLFSFQHDGFPVWAFVRLGLYMAAKKKDFEFEQFKREHSILTPKLGRREKIKLIGNSIKFLASSWKLRKSDILIVSRASNRVEKGGKYYDKFFDQIQIKGRTVALLEFPSFDGGIIHHKHNFNEERIVMGEFIYASELLNSKLCKVNFDNLDNIFKLYASFVKDNYHYDLSEELFHQYISTQINRQINRLHILKKLIEFAKPKALILKSSYDPMSQILNFYANKMDIETIEFQHGHIYSEHAGYFRSESLSSNIQSIYPRKIFVENQFYSNVLLCNGWKKKQIEVVGEIIKRNSVQYTTLESVIPENTHVVTVVNQHTLSSEIAALLRDAEFMPNYTFLIKLHPRLISQQVEAFTEVLKLDNVLLVQNEHTLEECFSVSDMAVGVYSTGLIDALKYEIPVNVINLPGCDFMDDLVTSRIMRKIDSLKEIIVPQNLDKNTLFLLNEDNLINQSLQYVFTK